MGLELNSCHLHADENDDAVTRGWKRFGYQRAQSYYPSGEIKSGSNVKMKMVNDILLCYKHKSIVKASESSKPSQSTPNWTPKPCCCKIAMRSGLFHSKFCSFVLGVEFWHVKKSLSFDFHQLLQNFGSFQVSNLAIFWASSFDFHQLSQNFWQFLGVEFGMFLSFKFWFPSSIAKFRQFLGVEFGMFLNFKFWFPSTISEVLAVFGCWIWHVFELQVLIFINYLRSFGSFWVLNLACFWTSSFDFHQLSQKFWQFLGVEFGMFFNFKFWFPSTTSEFLAVLGCWIWHVFKLQFWFPTTTAEFGQLLEVEIVTS
jgi:hypothetical protein